jgi:hypothetical protein
VKLWLVKKFADELPFLFIFNAREKFGSQSDYCLGFVERHLLVNLATRKVAGLAFRLEDWFDLRLEVWLSRGDTGKAGGSQDRRAGFDGAKSGSTPQNQNCRREENKYQQPFPHASDATPQSS